MVNLNQLQLPLPDCHKAHLFMQPLSLNILLVCISIKEQHINKTFLYIAELLELSGNAARDNRRTRITPRHILLAYANDEELYKVKENELNRLFFTFILVTSPLCTS
jgi:hypothetical protein